MSVRVRNTGDRDGAEVVQLYLHDLLAPVTRPVRQLAGFARVPLAAGSAAVVEFRLHADRTGFVGPDLRRIVEPGEVEVARRTVRGRPAAARHVPDHRRRREPGRDRVLFTGRRIIA